jgi:inhibitor of KinA
MDPVLTPAGEDALLVEYAPEIRLEVNRQVRRLAFALEQANVEGVAEIVPAYRSLMVYFDPARLELARLEEIVRFHADRADSIVLPAPRLFRIPTVYGGPYGPDLEAVAEAAGIPAAEVVRIFAAGRYPVYCLGFLCSLAYLGDLPAPLRLPRRATPRTRVPAGSVGVAGGQAVILPVDQPSGFHYLGRTFVTVYDPRHSPPTPIRPGDWVECPAVAEAEARRAEGVFLGELPGASSPGA